MAHVLSSCWIYGWFIRKFRLLLPLCRHYTDYLHILRFSIFSAVMGFYSSKKERWAATAVYYWRIRFKSYRDTRKQKEEIPPNHRLAGYVQLFTENVSKSPSVYAQFRGWPPVSAVSHTLVPQGIIKTVAVPATTDEK